MKLPKLPSVDIPKPATWDFIALAVLVGGAVLTGANVAVAGAQEGGSISASLTFLFVVFHLAVCMGGLMALGRTAAEGTIWGNLASLGACFVGMSGCLLAAALWATG